MTGRLEGKVAFVTGAGQGIGRAIARKMVAEGASVVIAELNRDSGQAVADELNAAGHQALFIPTDVIRENDIKQAIEQTTSHFGKLDILVNNAGITFRYEAVTMTEEQWYAAMDVDVKGVWLCCKYAIPHMQAQGGGAIVNISSVHGRVTAPKYFPYGAAKAAVLGLTRNIALDYGPHNIRINAICPGWVRTEAVEEWIHSQPDPKAYEDRILSFQPVRRIGTPEEIANLVAFVASDEASYMTGAELVIDGGLTIQYPQ
jgi:NAD(P)-dependent dehydrogenase (short-subunit alcohol dehydrogenase family)